MLVKSYYNPGASLFYPVAAPPGLGPLTPAGGNPLATATPNGVPITAATGLNVAAQAAAINAAAAVSASALHHNPAVLSHANHQLSVHHPAISPHLSQHHIAAVTNSGQPQQQLSNHLNFTNNAVDGPGGHAVSVATNSLQQQTQHRHHSSQPNHSQKTNLLQQPAAAAVHQVTSNQTLLHQQQNVQQSSAQSSGQPSLQNLVGHASASAIHHQSTKQVPSSPASKKFRPSYTRPSNKHARYVPKPMPQELSNLKTYSSPDILICGNCREMFSDLIDMLDHKRDYCKLRFTCKCDVLNEECTTCDLSTSELMNINCNQASQGDTNSADASINTSTSNNVPNDASISTALSNSLGTDVEFQNKNINNQKTESCANNGLHSNKNPSVNNTKSSHSDVSAKQQPKPRQKYLHCVSCNSPFSNAWDLMVHVQAAHMMNIYQLADSNKLQQAAKAKLMTETSNIEKGDISVENSGTKKSKSSGINDNLELEEKESTTKIKSSQDETSIMQDNISTQNGTTYSINTALTSTSLPIISNNPATTDSLNRNEVVMTNVDT